MTTTKMIKKFTTTIFFFAISIAQAVELVKIQTPYNAAHSGTPAMLRIIEQANTNQNIYRFVLEFKPGGNQTIALRTLDTENDLAIIAPAFVENADSGQINEQDYVALYALGDACWAVITNKAVKGQREFVVGGVGFGNAAHLTALALGERYKFNVRYVVFKSNGDAMVNMAGNNGVEFTIDKYEVYESLKTKNSNLRMVAASCPLRLPQEPKIPTLREQGITAPYIFNIIVAHRNMPVARQHAIATILKQATQDVGEKEIFRISAMRPPQFDNRNVEEFYRGSVDLIRTLQKKYKTQIEAASR